MGIAFGKDREYQSDTIIKQFGVDGFEQQLRLELKNIGILYKDIEEFQVDVLIEQCSKNSLKKLYNLLAKRTIEQLNDDKLFSILMDTIDWYSKQGIDII